MHKLSSASRRWSNSKYEGQGMCRGRASSSGFLNRKDVKVGLFYVHSYKDVNAEDPGYGWSGGIFKYSRGLCF